MMPVQRKLRNALGWSFRKLRRISEATRTCLRRVTRGSDVSRWADMRNLSEGWDSRTIQLAQMVPPGSHVLEFGAGRRTLERHLPAGCSYTPCDLVDRGPNTVVCDLNSPTYPVFPAHDVAMFSGVLEYIQDIPRLVAHLSSHSPIIIASYAGWLDNGLSEKLDRRSMGWVNDLTSEEFLRIFTDAGYECVESKCWDHWDAHRLFRFELRSKCG